MRMPAQASSSFCAFHRYKKEWVSEKTPIYGNIYKGISGVTLISIKHTR